ncbi:MAG: hypothetical protein AB7F79_05785 [Steroidobacteraceae bacterium]
MSIIRVRRVVGSCLAALFGLQAMTTLAQPIDATAAVSAQWQSFDLRFNYFGFTTYYSCDGLEDRLEQILKQLGAHEDVRVSVSGCAGFNAVNNALSARIRVRMPMARDATQDDSHDESFTAISTLVTLQTLSAGSHVGAGDCELLEQVRDQLLPELKLQPLKDTLRCIPGQGQVGSQSLQVMALLAKPTVD